MTSWLYWSESERNVEGEELATCLHLYDTGGERDDDRDLETKLVFLDETRSTGYSRGCSWSHSQAPSCRFACRSRPTYLQGARRTTYECWGW